MAMDIGLYWKFKWEAKSLGKGQLGSQITRLGTIRIGKLPAQQKLILKKAEQTWGVKILKKLSKAEQTSGIKIFKKLKANKNKKKVGTRSQRRLSAT